VILVRDKKLLAAFGKHLKHLRETKGLSQEELGLEAEIGKNQVGLIERGEINPTLSTLNALAVSLNISLSELIRF
jgi:transcriptional regulator with XRE-family HTH domain